MTYPKLKRCPNCGSDNVGVYVYETGWNAVECDDCTARTALEGRKLDAIREHNRRAELAEAAR